MARVIAATLAALALWLAYCLSGVAWRLLRIARHRPETAADPVRFGLLGAAKVAPHGLLYPAAMVESATVVAVGARDPSRAHRFASSWGIPRSGDYDAVPRTHANCTTAPEWRLPALNIHDAPALPYRGAALCTPTNPLHALQPCTWCSSTAMCSDTWAAAISIRYCA